MKNKIHYVFCVFSHQMGRSGQLERMRSRSAIGEASVTIRLWTKCGDGCPTHFNVRVTYSVLDIAHSCGVSQLC